MEEKVEKRDCQLCSATFSVFAGDLRFYQQYGVFAPRLCFDCRLQRRLAFYNRRNLYRRKCDYSGEEIISVFSPNKVFKVYNKSMWYSDKWDPLYYGRAFDFSRPFFEQFWEMMTEVPLPSLAVIDPVINSEFTNDNSDLKDCYLVFDCAYSEKVLYGETFVRVRDSIDILDSRDLELCYECIDCQNCYNLKYSLFCQNCFDSWFLRDCIGCRNCFGCANLRNKEYYIFNKKVTKEEYTNFLQQHPSGEIAAYQEMQHKVDEFFLSQPVKAMRGTKNENVEGDHLYNCKNTFYCFNCKEIEDCRYCTYFERNAKNCMDCHVWGHKAELCYNCCVIGDAATNILCSCFVGVGCSDVAYSFLCTRNCHNLFGCVGLRQKRNCILNKQYSADEYEKLRSRIVAHMKETGEWGEFFPPHLSPFGYNESLAFSPEPMSKDEVTAIGWNWCDYESPIVLTEALLPEDLPVNIREVPENLPEKAIMCELTEKLFKIVTPELMFYKKHNLPLPRRHPDQRHRDRLKFKNSHRLWERLCDRCGRSLQTSYAPDSSYTIYCEDCYQTVVD